MKTIVIGANDAGQRLDKFLTKAFPNLPQAMLYKSIRKKDIKRNGKRCEISARLEEGDTLTRIAQMFGTTVEALTALNGLADPSLIYVGQILYYR